MTRQNFGIMSFHSQPFEPSTSSIEINSPQQRSNSRKLYRTCVRVNPQWLVDPGSEDPEDRQVVVSVKRHEDFPLFISDVVEVMRPLTLETGGIPLRVLRVPVRATKAQDKPFHPSDSSRMNVQEITYFTHALDDFLLAEQLELLWNFSMFSRGAALPFLNEVERLDIASLSGQFRITLTSTFMSLSWTEQHWIKFFDVCVRRLCSFSQDSPPLAFSSQLLDNFDPSLVSLNPLGFSHTTTASPTTIYNKGTHSSITIPRPRPATGVEKASLVVRPPRSYTKLDEPLSTDLGRNITTLGSSRYRTKAQEIHRPLHLRERKPNSSLRSSKTHVGAKKIPITSPYGSPNRLNNSVKKDSLKANQLSNQGEAIRPTNVYGRDRGKSIFQKPAFPNRIWVNPKITETTARSTTDRDSASAVVSSKKFTMDPRPSPSSLQGEDSSPLKQPGHRALTYEQRLYTVTHLNALVHKRGEDIFAILRCYCPELLRQSKSSDSINLTSVPDKVIRQLYRQVILHRPVKDVALHKAPDLWPLSSEDRDFLWEEYPKLGLGEQRELSKIIEAIAPNVQYGIMQNSIPLVKRLPITVQHFVLKYVKDRKAQFDEVEADAEEYLQKCARAEEDEELQKVRKWTNAILEERKAADAEKFEKDIWNQREEALNASQEPNPTNPDLLFGKPRVKRRPKPITDSDKARYHFESILSTKPGRDTRGRRI